jgi:hypothetical protein
MGKNQTTKRKNKKPNQKINQKTKKFKELNCSPKKNFDFTCYSSTSLNKLKLLWNKKHPEKKIKTNNSREIWESLKNNQNNVCNTERCWLNQNFAKNNLDSELKNYTFAPKSPPTWRENPNEWLDSNDLNKVMRQYEKSYPSFSFIGPSPIDFDKKKLFGQCVWNELCNFNLESYIKKGKNKIGIIFNTDPHYLDGSHWICLFVNVKKNFIFFFDSNADRTPTQIIKLVKKIQKQAKSLNIDLIYSRNKTEHQKTDTECGMYVLYVITQLLKNKMSLDMFNERIPDKDMEHLRKIFFN